MGKLLPLLLLLTQLPAAAEAPMEDGSAPLQQIRQNVAAQLARSANYTCVEALERTYYLTKTPEIACRQLAPAASNKIFAQDRLRLDVAVSEHAEIYSWHGENKFTSSNIAAVVQGGPISSGGFIGYLNNVFLRPGVIFRFEGKSASKGVDNYQFSYNVPLSASLYRIRVKEEPVLVPFHGSFKANAMNLQLTEMTVVADDIPKNSELCSVETGVNYQLARISGFEALIPASFDLRVGSEQNIYTESHADYLGCREYRSESTLHFDADDANTGAAPQRTVAAGPLPEGIELRVALKTDLSDKNSYAGDPVDAVLLRKVTLKGSRDVIPAGALINGVITKLENRFEPERHVYLRIEFRQLASPGKTGTRMYSMRAVRKPGDEQSMDLRFLFGAAVPPGVASEVKEGSLVIPGHRFHLRPRYSGDWVTVKPHER